MYDKIHYNKKKKKELSSLLDTRTPLLQPVTKWGLHSQLSFFEHWPSSWKFSIGDIMSEVTKTLEHDTKTIGERGTRISTR